MDQENFEYDVAFSFEGKDEALATQIADLISDRFNVFLYSRKQDVLAGTDGEERFNTVFGTQARFVVVLYRKEWGETPFTRIEATAIRNRAFYHGYDFTLFVATDDAGKPDWLPKPRLYYGLSRFGLPGVAGAIESRIQELGGEPRSDTIADRAARLDRANALRAAQERFEASDDGVREAAEAFEHLTTALVSTVASFSAAHQTLAGLRVRKLHMPNYWLLHGDAHCVVVSWTSHYANSLKDSVLRAELYRGFPRTLGLMGGFEDARLLKRKEFDYRLVAQGQAAYTPRNDKHQSFSPVQIADHLLRLYMDAVDRHETA